MNQRVTLKDVARLAGVSFQTVSKVLHGRMSVSDETRDRIYQAIETLDYKPNQAAQNLRTARSRTIGYSWKPAEEGNVNPILESFLQGMMMAASYHDYELLCFPEGNDETKSLQKYHSLHSSGRVDGFILSNVEYDDARVLYLKNHNIPFSSFGCSSESVEYPYVDVDGRAGMQAVVWHVVNEGYTKIALLAWSGESRVGNERMQGYKRGMDKIASKIQKQKIYYGAGTVSSGYSLTKDLLHSYQADAIIAFNDLMAIGAMNAIKESGQKVGKDIGVTGYDDFPMVQFYTPALTSVAQPAKAAGEKVIELLVDDLIFKQNNGKYRNNILIPKLIIRDSSIRNKKSH